MKNAEKFKSIFGLYATELWAMDENNMLKWLNAECKEPERKPGKWHVIKGTGLASCECGHITDRYSTYDFCPVCGAPMKKGENND